MNMNILNSICITTMVLLVWFNTDAFISYMSLFKLDRFFKIKEYQSDLEKDFTLEYPVWLKNKHSCFFTKLVSCPWCIGFWVSLLTCICLGTFYIFPVMYLCSVTIYFIIINKIL